MNLARRIKRLESARFDATGLEPGSEAWFAFYEDKLFRLLDDEDIGGIRIPLAVTDRLIAEAVRAHQAKRRMRRCGATAPGGPR